VENEAARPGRNGSRGADRGLEARPCPSGVCAANHVLSGLSRWFSKQVSPIHHSLGLSPSRMERCPSLHCQPCFLQNFETVKFPPENILECSGMCVFDTSASPQVSSLSPGEEICAGHPVARGLPGGEHSVCAVHVQLPAAVQQVRWWREGGGFAGLGVHTLHQEQCTGSAPCCYPGMLGRALSSGNTMQATYLSLHF
jgi:hypothetical protein